MSYISGANIYENGLLGKVSDPDPDGILDSKSGDYYLINGKRIAVREAVFESVPMLEDVHGNKVGEIGTSTRLPSKDSYLVIDNIYEDGISEQLDGNVTYEDYPSGETDYSYTGSNYVNRHVYINGVKQISGETYSVTGDVLYLHRAELNELGDANVTFTPMNEYSNQQLYSGGGAFVQAEFPLVKPQVWKNGVRMVEGVDYVLTSSGDLLNSTVRIPENNSLLYLGETGFFNQ